MSASLRALSSRFLLPAYLGLAAVTAPCAIAADSDGAGLLFYLSGEKGTTADFAATGTAEPTFVNNVARIPDGAKGAALSCEDLQRLSYIAPGNIYAQRGTLSFFWRSRYPVGPTEFPVFRVGYADHSSWDMVWLRIDYNGHGFDAFVTDASLSRTRVSVKLDSFPKPNEWTHLALAWDETRGIRFYVNGKLASENKTTAVYDAGLDQFGPHSRIISPYQVQSDYNFVRGGDIDEVRIYDHMLADGELALLGRGEGLSAATPAPSALPAGNAFRDEWTLRYGWNRATDAALELPAGRTAAIRKVEITDAYDLKRWWWKATDGIRETTWPGVYNRSRLTGRHDYFTLPDWDCYFDSGKAVTFALPNEPWNHLEISGAAWGKMELLPANTALETASDAKAESVLFQRRKGDEKTVHALSRPLTGRQIRFTNTAQEQPIGELSAYNVTAGAEPAGSTKLVFKISSAGASASDQASVSAIANFISGRHPASERRSLVAHPAGSSGGAAVLQGQGAPIVHVLIPDTWDNLTDGLDGIAIDLPAVSPASGSAHAFNIRIKDPLWLNRDMLDFTYGNKAGAAKTLWLDLRDRLLPKGKGIYLAIASANPNFGPQSLEGAEIRLVFKPREAARAEHELDRFTQARDSYAMLVEEHPTSPKLNLWNRFKGDLDDLLRVNPNHVLGRQYAAAGVAGTPRPAFKQPEPPAGVPLWAFRQTELLGRVKYFVNWYIDHRQVPYGDFGGGISDDVDLVNAWPATALMGVIPEKITQSLRALLDASYVNGMFTNGLPAIQADELHSYEEGINCIAQNLILDYASPRQLERAMETARGIETITGLNAAGHRHIRTSYYSGTRMAEDSPWDVSKPYSYLVLQVPQLLVDYNGNPAAKKYLLELTDSLIAHGKRDASGRFTIPMAIRFGDDRELTATRTFFPWHVFWGAWKWTGDRKYLSSILDSGPQAALTINANAIDLLDLRKEMTARMFPTAGPAQAGDALPAGRADTSRGGSASAHVLWKLGGDKSHLERLYATQIEECALMEYINTDGSLWSDRVNVPYTDIQRDRLGGVAMVRNALYPGHVISWKFAAPANDQSVAVLVPNSTLTSFKVIAYNLETTAVRATMTGWNIDPGTWEITQGIDTNNDDTADQAMATRSAPFERASSVELTLPPRATTILNFTLKTPATPYWQRPDLGIDPQDVTVRGRDVRVKVHSLGSVPAPASTISVRDAAGRVLATTAIPALAAPVDLWPKTTDVRLTLPAGTATAGVSVEIDPDHKLEEITDRNNTVQL